MSIKNNTASLQNLLEQVNALPEADGVELPELQNEGSAEDLMLNKELIDANGNKVTGTFSIDTELSTQDDLISQIQTALQDKVSAPKPVLQTKTVTPTTNVQNVAPDSGYDGLSKVTVNAIPSTYIKPTTTKTTTTYTPTTSNQTIAAGTYCSGTQTIKGDANLKAENIKNGVSIFGVNGNYIGSGISVETCIVTLINTNKDSNYDIMGTWIENSYIGSYETSVYDNSSKEKMALKGSYLALKPSIFKSISGNYQDYGTYTGAKIIRINGNCTITLQ